MLNKTSKLRDEFFLDKPHIYKMRKSDWTVNESLDVSESMRNFGYLCEINAEAWDFVATVGLTKES